MLRFFSPGFHNAILNFYSSLVKLPFKSSFTWLTRYYIEYLFKPTETDCLMVFDDKTLIQKLQITYDINYVKTLFVLVCYNFQ